MKNDQRDIDGIIGWIGALESRTSIADSVAETTADYVNGVFILIPREELPEINHGSLDDAIAGNAKAMTTYLTEDVFNGDFKKMRDLGLQYLVMSDHVEQRGIKAEIDTAKARRFKVFKELFPENICTLNEFDWATLHSFEQMVIDKMVLMKMELDKNF